MGSRILTSFTATSPPFQGIMDLVLVLVLVAALEAQDIGYDVQHILFFDDDIGHRRMRGLHPHSESRSGHTGPIGHLAEASRFGQGRLLGRDPVTRRAVFLGVFESRLRIPDVLGSKRDGTRRQREEKTHEKRPHRHSSDCYAKSTPRSISASWRISALMRVNIKARGIRRRLAF